jgi:ribosomal protein S27E
MADAEPKKKKAVVKVTVKAPAKGDVKPGFKPYEVKCPGCKTAIKVKSKEQIGERVKCAGCGRAIDINSPDEEGSIPYNVGEKHEKPQPRGPSEEEIEEMEAAERKQKRDKTILMTKFIISTIITLAFFVFVGFLLMREWDRFQKWQAEQKPIGKKSGS